MRDVRNGLRIAGLFGLAFSAGAGAMYLFDPHRGRSRRVTIRDKAYRFARQSEHFVEKAGRDLRNRTAGAIHEARSMLRHEDVADVKLIGRVRAKLGRLTSQPHAIVVSAEQGRVTLEGAIRQQELARTLDSVRRIEGVREIDNRLEAHNGDVAQPASAKSNWAPVASLGACLAGAVVGVLILTRGTTNRDASRRLKELIRS